MASVAGTGTEVGVSRMEVVQDAYNAITLVELGMMEIMALS